MSNKRKYTDYELILEYFRRMKYEPNESLMVDVGAQIGLWSRAYVKLGWSVVALEPEQTNFNELLENIPSSKMFHPRQIAISDKAEEERKFFFSPERNGIHSLELNHKALAADTYQVVKVSTLDRVLVDFTQPIRLLKLDIEGAELNALKGFNIDRFKPEIVICEFGARSVSFGSTFRDLAIYGLGHGYRCLVSHKRNLENTVLWLGEFDQEYVRELPDDAWGEIIFVRPDAYDALFTTLEAFDTPFEVALTH